jgi:hypothetical protein
LNLVAGGFRELLPAGPLPGHFARQLKTAQFLHHKTPAYAAAFDEVNG